MTDRHLQEEMKMSYKTFQATENALQKKDPPVLKIKKTNYRDQETGLPVLERHYDFNAFYNAVALEFLRVQDELDTKVSTDELQAAKEELRNEFKEELNKLRKENEALRKEQEIKNQIIL